MGVNKALPSVPPFHRRRQAAGIRQSPAKPDTNSSKLSPFLWARAALSCGRKQAAAVSKAFSRSERFFKANLFGLLSEACLFSAGAKAY
jgi:hypothetical protein